ncbi:1,2-dihydroxy-3-keto-5-methylthiopentene dioxygenase [Rhizina undulata]
MKVYEYDNTSADQREDHDSGIEVSIADLEKIGVLAYHFDDLESVNKLAVDRSYKNRDEITVSPAAMGAVYEDKVKMFFQEHLHEDEEIRYILDGEGFFDVRTKDDRWIRIRMVKGDMIILPAGIYHRFTTDNKNYIKALRLFRDEPKWTPLNRGPEVDENTFRKSYIQSLKASA